MQHTCSLCSTAGEYSSQGPKPYLHDILFAVMSPDCGMCCDCKAYLCGSEHIAICYQWTRRCIRAVVVVRCRPVGRAVT